MRSIFSFIVIIQLASFLFAQKSSQLRISDRGYFETQGFNALVFNNFYDKTFGDAKISGVEFIHHGVRTVTNGDVRLSPTPAQWEPCPTLTERKVDEKNNAIQVTLSYSGFNFEYIIKAEAYENGLLLSVNLNKPLPTELEGLAGFNLEFLPSAYFEKTFLMDDKSGVFPMYPTGPMEKTEWGIIEPLPIAEGKTIVFAPEDDESRITVKSLEGSLALYDGRNQAQNGWYVLRTLIPSNKTGKVVEWFVTANTIPGWIREPVITYSQVGYHPSQKKVAVIEFDKNDTPIQNAKLLKLTGDGIFEDVLNCELKNWGGYLRYNYYTFDFSSIEENGLYVVEYNSKKTSPFRIAEDVYTAAWHSTNDIFFPVQMDHMFVNEAYRVWHGASHLDDALQAPVNHVHFDLYAQGFTTDSPYQPGEHIPGLNVGGWFDAGDHDIRTQTNYAVVQTLVQTWETFNPMRDETTIDQQKRYVDIHIPDGKPDILQQIEHGTLQLMAQFKSVGHAIPGIIPSSLSQYTHLGDAVTITDNLIFNSKLKVGENDGLTSGTFDDRWAFTTKTTPLNYGSIAALTAASRALRGFNDSLASECLAVAIKVWNEEHTHEPDLFRFGNTTGGQILTEEMKAAVELFVTTKDEKYSKRINELLPKVEDRFGFFTALLVRIIPFMPESFSEKLKKMTVDYKSYIETRIDKNPFGVLISEDKWAGSALVVSLATNNFMLHKAFPDIIDKEFVFSGLNYIFGCHPGSNISFVSNVGAQSKKIAYGNNRADFSFIAGGVVPGVLILEPDFPENKDDWPFFWGENEYVVGLGANYIFLVNAANELLNE